jgi:hypothetical protein
MEHLDDLLHEPLTPQRLGLDRNLATLARRAGEGFAQSRCASLACASG